MLDPDNSKTACELIGHIGQSQRKICIFYQDANFSSVLSGASQVHKTGNDTEIGIDQHQNIKCVMQALTALLITEYFFCYCSYIRSFLKLD